MSRKAALGAGQLLLALCGTVLIVYVPIAFACRGDASIAIITVRAKWVAVCWNIRCQLLSSAWCTTVS